MKHQIYPDSLDGFLAKVTIAHGNGKKLELVTKLNTKERGNGFNNSIHLYVNGVYINTFYDLNEAIKAYNEYP